MVGLARAVLPAIAAVALFVAGPARAGFGEGWAAFEADDYSAALEAWLPLARRGDLDALYNVGALYEHGLGVDADPGHAAQWYARAARRDFAPAQFRLARLYETGRGVEADRDKALEWYRKAAEQGYADAQFNLGVVYETGAGVPPDPGQAARWYRRAAQRGLAAAQYNLGRLHYAGLGTPKNLGLAVEWYRRAAEGGSGAAQNNLAYMYERGLGVPRDASRAAQWYRKAARQGDTEAQTHLALLLANGEGVERDPVEAYAWLSIAAEAPGEAGEAAARYRERLAAQLDADQRAEGKRRAGRLRKTLVAARRLPERVLPRETAALGVVEVTAQRRLAMLGHYDAIVDGIVGPGTRAAIRAFQREAGLAVDGRVSAALLEALDAAVRRRFDADKVPAAEADDETPS